MSEVIIDGCNVAECEFIVNSIPADCDNDTCFCYENPNCYFKQLQRAKAELEQYKKSKQASYEAMQAEWNNAVNELRDVKVENEKLKSLINMHLTTFDKCCVNGLIMSNNMSEVLNEQNDR